MAGLAVAGYNTQRSHEAQRSQSDQVSQPAVHCKVINQPEWRSLAGNHNNIALTRILGVSLQQIERGQMGDAACVTQLNQLQLVTEGTQAMVEGVATDCIVAKVYGNAELPLSNYSGVLAVCAGQPTVELASPQLIA
jgi:hypothetical protein